MRKMKTAFFTVKGFTLIEVIITASILIILGGMSLTAFIRTRTAHDLTETTQNILSVLILAQSRQLAGQDNSVWGVHLQSNQIALFKGLTYASSPLIQTYSLPSSIQLTNILLAGGGIDVIFKRVSGETDTSGTFQVNVIASPSMLSSVTIDGSGKAYKTTPPPTVLVNRLVDTRHRSFSLGWSIKTATTMTLTFTNPSTTQSITMAPFFDVGKTKFDWSGTVPVGGQNQVLRIHTTSLTVSNATLSVDRDCRTNNKQLTIDIDGQVIATYAADCLAITLGPFGGTISEP